MTHDSVKTEQDVKQGFFFFFQSDEKLNVGAHLLCSDYRTETQSNWTFIFLRLELFCQCLWISSLRFITSTLAGLLRDRCGSTGWNVAYCCLLERTFTVGRFIHFGWWLKQLVPCLEVHTGKKIQLPFSVLWRVRHQQRNCLYILGVCFDFCLIFLQR